MQKKKKSPTKNQENTNTATKEQIPPFRRAFQKSDECWGAPELFVKYLPGDTLHKVMVNDQKLENHITVL